MSLENELNSLSEEIADYWFKNNRKKDFRFFELFSKVNKLAYNATNRINLDNRDVELANVMSFVEKRFCIPVLKINIKSWLNEDKNNDFVLDVYRKLSLLRSL